MGTNFYVRRLPTEERKSRLSQLVYVFTGKVPDILKAISEGRFNEAENIFNDITECFEKEKKKVEQRVHLGKRSAGWQFLWEYHSEHYTTSLSSIKEFITNPDFEIEDEYGKKFTADEFLEEIKDILYKTDDLYDLPSYYKKCRENGEKLLEFGLNSEFTSEDGLRFCTNDFS